MLNYLKYDYLRSRIQADFNDHTHLYSFKTIKKLINEMCLYFGSSLEGRKASFQYHMNIRKHVPIYINSSLVLLEIIPDLWVNYFAIKKVTSSKEKGCYLLFKDKSSLLVDHSSFILNRFMLIYRFCKMMLFNESADHRNPNNSKIAYSFRDGAY